MNDRKPYVLQESIDTAYKKFTELEDHLKTPVNMMLIARENAPKTFAQAADVLVEHPLIVMAMEARPGYLLFDVVVATVTNAIGTSMSDKYVTALENAQGAVERNKLLIAGR